MKKNIVINIEQIVKKIDVIIYTKKLHHLKKEVKRAIIRAVNEFDTNYI